MHEPATTSAALPSAGGRQAVWRDASSARVRGRRGGARARPRRLCQCSGVRPRAARICGAGPARGAATGSKAQCGSELSEASHCCCSGPRGLGHGPPALGAARTWAAAGARAPERGRRGCGGGVGSRGRRQGVGGNRGGGRTQVQESGHGGVRGRADAAARDGRNRQAGGRRRGREAGGIGRLQHRVRRFGFDEGGSHRGLCAHVGALPGIFGSVWRRVPCVRTDRKIASFVLSSNPTRTPLCRGSWLPPVRRGACVCCPPRSHRSQTRARGHEQ